MSRNVPMAKAADQLGCSPETLVPLILSGQLVAYRYAPPGASIVCPRCDSLSGGADETVYVSQDSIDAFLHEARIASGELLLEDDAVA